MLKTEVEECDLAFITAGLGGGTGTGSAHVVARLAKASEALTIAVVSYPSYQKAPYVDRMRNGV